jgi:DNA-binding MarR family transcriptional regulator
MSEPVDATVPDWAGPEDQIAILVMRLSGDLGAYLARQVSAFGLTFPQALLIRQLRQPLPMKAAADRMHCDASNLTGIVDRLETRGLVERRTRVEDRRVKELVLTSEGELLRGQLDRVSAFTPGIRDLSTDDQARLIGLLRTTLESLQEADRAT